MGPAARPDPVGPASEPGSASAFRPDPERVRAVLGAPDLAWLVERCRTRLERGHPLTGTVTRNPASAAERAAVARLLGRRTGRGTGLTVHLAEVAAELADAGIAADLRTAVEVLSGPLRDRPAERTAERDRVDAAADALRAGPHRGAPWYDAWVDALHADGTLTRLVRRGDGHLPGAAGAVLGRLPADGGLALPVLAERAVGDTKALTGTPLARLVLRALAGRAGTDPPRGRREERDVWATAGFVVDDLASQVLVLNLRGAGGGLLSGWLDGAAGQGIPFRITLHQLSLAPFTPRAAEVYVCENPAVLRTAAVDLGAGSRPLVCTEGVPSAACLHLLDAAAAAGSRLRWHADLDWTGLRGTGQAVHRFGAEPWRMGCGDYLAALARGESEPLRGPRADSPWDPQLAAELERTGRAVMEERVLGDLLGDLRS
jgi:uncharacterized protein (TIGR02679 family)